LLGQSWAAYCKHFNRATETGEWGTYKQTLALYDTEIRMAEVPHGGVLPGDVPGGATHMKIMAKQATYKVGSARLQHVTVVTLLLVARLCKNCAVSFPGYRLVHGSSDGRGQPDVGACLRKRTGNTWPER
jgi:hypothetical protein